MTNIIGVDIGSTNICCYIFDERCQVKGNSHVTIEREHPKPGYTEINPEKLWDQFRFVVNDAIKSAGITVHDITTMGISVQRGSFITWDRNTGEPLHNFIGWQDLRACKEAEEWNASFTVRSIKMLSKILFTITGNNRYKAASVITFSPYHCSMKLHWILKNDPTVYQKAHNGTLLFGTVDSWLIWKMSAGKLHVSDYANASSTGIFDPYTMSWSQFFCTLLDFPQSILPSFVDTSGFVVDIDESIFGASIPVHGLAADQQASVFGQCCFEEGDINCTLGTGTFIDINTGSHPHASIGGLYPLVGWVIRDETVFIAEGNTQGTSASIELMKTMGLFDDVAMSSHMAYSVESSNGICFVPAFSGIQAPINDPRAVTMLLGMNTDTAKSHMVRAVLESVAFRFCQLYEIAVDEIRLPVGSSMMADGGVTRNDFVMQLIASLTDHDVDRATFSDMSAAGAAYFAGLGVGVWKCKDEIKNLRASRRMFLPKKELKDSYKSTFELWEKALQRSLRWFKDF